MGTPISESTGVTDAIFSVRRRSSAELFDVSSVGAVSEKKLPAPLTKVDKKKMEKLQRNMKEILGKEPVRFPLSPY